MPERKLVYICGVCGWVYDPEDGYPEAEVEPGTDFDSLPTNFECPDCGADKDEFDEEQQ